MDRTRKSRAAILAEKRRKAARRKRNITLSILIAVILIMLLILILLIKNIGSSDSGKGAPSGNNSSNGNTSKTSSVNYNSYPLFSEQPYFSTSKILSVYDGCFVVDTYGESDINEYAVISLSGRVICDNIEGKKFYEYRDLGNNTLMLAGFLDSKGYERFVCFDSNGQIICRYNGTDGANASTPENGNYYVITGDSFDGYTSVFYRLDGSEITRVNGYARSSFNKYGFALVTASSELTSGIDTLIDMNGRIVEFTIAQDSDYAGKKVQSFEFRNVNDRITSADLWFDDGTSTYKDYVVIDMENKQLHIMDTYCNGIYDEYVLSGSKLLDKYGKNIIINVRSVLNDSGANIIAMLSEKEKYLGVIGNQGLMIVDVQGNVIAGPIQGVYLNNSIEINAKKEANSAGLFTVTMQGYDMNGWQYGVMNLKGEFVVPAVHDSIVCTDSGYIILNGREILNSQGQTVFSIN